MCVSFSFSLANIEIRNAHFQVSIRIRIDNVTQ